jgi:hypothetical protein
MNPHNQNNLTLPCNKLAWRLKEIADATGFSVPFLRKKEREGELKTKSVGRCKIVLNEDLLQFLNGEPT